MTETTSLFALSPPGLTGMAALGRHLDGLKRTGTIADWHPGRWETYKKERTGIRFDNPEDAGRAAISWAAEAALAPASAPTRSMAPLTS